MMCTYIRSVFNATLLRICHAFVRDPEAQRAMAQRGAALQEQVAAAERRPGDRAHADRESRAERGGRKLPPVRARRGVGDFVHIILEVSH